MANYELQVSSLVKVRNDVLPAALNGRLADRLTGRLIYLVTGKPGNQVTE